MALQKYLRYEFNALTGKRVKFVATVSAISIIILAGNHRNQASKALFRAIYSETGLL